MVDALIVTTDADHPHGPHPHLARAYRGPAQHHPVEGPRASVTFARGDLRVVVDPTEGQAGRPSSAQHHPRGRVRANQRRARSRPWPPDARANSSALPAVRKGFSARSIPIVVGTVGSPRSRAAKIASACAAISGRSSTLRAKRALAAVYSWRTVQHRLVGPGREAAEAVPHLLGRALEQPSAAEREQGVADEGDGVGGRAIDDVAQGMARRRPSPAERVSPSMTGRRPRQHWSSGATLRTSSGPDDLAAGLGLEPRVPLGVIGVPVGVQDQVQPAPAEACELGQDRLGVRRVDRRDRSRRLVARPGSRSCRSRQGNRWTVRAMRVVLGSGEPRQAI